MTRTGVAGLAVAALLVGAGAGVAATAHDGDDLWLGHGMDAGIGAGSGPAIGSGTRSVTSGEQAYLTEMVAHHREAIRMAGELARSDRPEMRRLGETIVSDQTAQVTEMEGWLSEWYDGDTGDPDYHPMMRDLTGLSGDRLDRTFLVDMVRHHMVAVMTSQHLLMSGRVEHPEVATLARDIRDQQRREILRMRAWLAEWFG